MTEAYPDNNPKTVLGVTKAPLHLVPPSVVQALAEAFADGARKYGPYNWRDKTVSSSVYIGAAKRHIDAWWDGEAVSRDAGVHHLAHALACLAIIVDAETVNKLNDDRPTPGAAADLQEAYANKNKKQEPKQLELYFLPGHGLPPVRIDNQYAMEQCRVPHVQEDVRPQA